MPTHEIEKSIFDTGSIEERMRYDVWRESISCLFNVDATRENRDPRRFNATIKALRVGNLMLTETRSVAQLWQRRPLEIARDGLDHYMVELFLSGSAHWDSRYGEQIVRPGDIIVFDFACEMQAHTTDFEHLSLIIPRSLLGPMLDYPDHHHMQVLSGSLPVVRMLADYIVSLNRNLPLMDNVEGHKFGPAVAAMVAACLNSHGPIGRVSGASTGYHFMDFRIRAFIQENLDNADLDVNQICDGCGISRSALYRLFSEEGGVRHFLREQRLSKAMRDLLFYPELQISMVARRNGFTHANDFSRAFRRRFGLTPRELRATQARYNERQQKSPTEAGREYESWLRQIGDFPEISDIIGKSHSGQ
ncbi:helix-turn-helix domain-containing protein [Thalassospira marina]|uniref:HTH araC/xylS-type domain-containing protein n=1 Tax=Thalassospira marina TaxID=2048283 RepID=A0A2N3KN15_9PROT|nr:helix-turn-helix domain-containing protein [Thalassospira marina]PKR51863.1 hypothetical protein COO20_18675 [Thalassospira marina]